MDSFRASARLWLHLWLLLLVIIQIIRYIGASLALGVSIALGFWFLGCCWLLLNITAPLSLLHLLLFGAGAASFCVHLVVNVSLVCICSSGFCFMPSFFFICEIVDQQFLRL